LKAQIPIFWESPLKTFFFILALFTFEGQEERVRRRGKK
jgi:hypothetical protein